MAGHPFPKEFDSLPRAGHHLWTCACRAGHWGEGAVVYKVRSWKLGEGAVVSKDEEPECRQVIS